MRESIGYLPQLFILYPNLSVKENIDFSASLYGMSWFGRRKRRREGARVRRVVGPPGQAGPRHLGRHAAAPQPGIVADPQSAADLPGRANRRHRPDPAREVLGRVPHAQVEGRTLFVTTQYVTEAEYCDQVAVIGEGPDHRDRHAREPAYTRFRGRNRRSALPTDRPRDPAALGRVSGIQSIDTSIPGRARLVVENASTAMPVILDLLRGENLEVEGIEQYRPNFDEVFIHLLEQAQTATRTGRRPGRA